MAEDHEADALLAAITDAAPPEGARDDPVLAAEHRAAREDVRVLREQLVVIGDALAGPPGAAGRPAAARSGSLPGPGKKGTGPSAGRRGAVRPGGPPARSRRRGMLAVAAGALTAVAVASLVVAAGRLVAGGGAGEAASGDAKAADRGGSSLSAPGYIACSRLIAEGTVTGVRAVPGTGQDRVTLDVYHYYKPDTGAREVTFLMGRDAVPRLHRGEEVLVGIPRHASAPDIWTTGDRAIARERSWIVKALPEARRTECGG